MYALRVVLSLITRSPVSLSLLLLYSEPMIRDEANAIVNYHSNKYDVRSVMSRLVSRRYHGPAAVSTSVYL